MISLLLAVIYVSFISLGLPDSLLGSAWPVMYKDLQVPVSYAGILSMIIALGTVVSSLQSDRLTKKFGCGLVTAISVGMTAAALFGFSVSRSFFLLCLWAIPYGLGAGSVDASLNNYVALHFASRHMSWLHCMWGVGASAGPYLMSYALTGGKGWNSGYAMIALIQVALTLILILSLPLWKTRSNDPENADSNADASKEPSCGAPLTLKQIIKVPGAVEIMVAFFCYSAVEQTTGLWASSYLVLNRSIAAETAASWASLFFLGITAGRAVSGFLTMKLNDVQMIRMGQGIIAAGILILMLPIGKNAALLGLVLVGAGCAPIYPCIIHATPANFGPDKSQAVIGVQMASAYVGTCLMPPLFGLIANHVNIGLFPFYLLLALALMTAAHERMQKRAGR